MSEIKRIPLQSAEFTAPAPKKKHEKIKPPNCCFRFELNLSESNDKKFPEFNYRQLLKNAEKKRRKDKRRPDEPVNGAPPMILDEDDQDDDKVKKAAEYFEAKYGKAKRKNGDIDLGAGYDESDPFIDNSDAYDEIVPEEVTTVHGGFYINSGPLEFKHADNIKKLLDHVNLKESQEEDGEEDEDDDEEDTESSVDTSDEESTNKKVNKRVLSSSENDEGDDKRPPKSKPKVDQPKSDKMEEG